MSFWNNFLLWQVCLLVAAMTENSLQGLQKASLIFAFFSLIISLQILSPHPESTNLQQETIILIAPTSGHNCNYIVLWNFQGDGLLASLTGILNILFQKHDIKG